MQYRAVEVANDTNIRVLSLEPRVFGSKYGLFTFRTRQWESEVNRQQVLYRA